MQWDRCGCQNHGTAPNQDEVQAPQGDDVVDQIRQDPGQQQFHHGADELDKHPQAHPGDKGFDVVQDHFHGGHPFTAFPGIHRPVTFILSRVISLAQIS